jgi:hypothetical protein
LRITANLPRAGNIIVRRFIYPAWVVRINGQQITPHTEVEDPLMVVPVPQGPFILTVDWTATPDVRLSRWISGLAALLLPGLWFLERRTSRAHLS